MKNRITEWLSRTETVKGWHKLTPTQRICAVPLLMLVLVIANIVSFSVTRLIITAVRFWLR